MQRDQIINEQFIESGVNLSKEQDTIQKNNHPSCVASKAQRGEVSSPTNLKIGYLVFIKDERSKNKARDC